MKITSDDLYIRAMHVANESQCPDKKDRQRVACKPMMKSYWFETSAPVSVVVSMATGEEPHDGHAIGSREAPDRGR